MLPAALAAPVGPATAVPPRPALLLLFLRLLLQWPLLPALRSTMPTASTNTPSLLTLPGAVLLSGLVLKLLLPAAAAAAAAAAGPNLSYKRGASVRVC